MSHLDYKKFVHEWMKIYAEGKTIDDLATKLDVKPTVVNSRAYLLRKRGVKLPSLSRVKREYDTDSLNSIIDTYYVKGSKR